MKLLLFTFLTLSAGQGPINKLPQIRDLLRSPHREEYDCLKQACKALRDMHVVIADVRMCLDDAIETSITLYLRNVNSVASLVLLRDLQNNNFVL
jgi:hypothetical protein